MKTTYKLADAINEVINGCVTGEGNTSVDIDEGTRVEASWDAIGDNYEWSIVVVEIYSYGSLVMDINIEETKKLNIQDED